ncbi:hypothetical protein K0M31_007911 [Melipona bicolor]|uniref:Uncharacterized protein n=1 Tax=Melipona bicolor TaxID=60889 RepID=A0AA40GDN8_9HYME|nr:hypothetical protein K0M31_007911 [Melipona bicolor]
MFRPKRLSINVPGITVVEEDQRGTIAVPSFSLLTLLCSCRRQCRRAGTTPPQQQQQQQQEQEQEQEQQQQQQQQQQRRRRRRRHFNLKSEIVASITPRHPYTRITE